MPDFVGCASSRRDGCRYLGDVSLALLGGHQRNALAILIEGHKLLDGATLHRVGDLCFTQVFSRDGELPIVCARSGDVIVSPCEDPASFWHTGRGGTLADPSGGLRTERRDVAVRGRSSIHVVEHYRVASVPT